MVLEKTHSRFLLIAQQPIALSSWNTKLKKTPTLQKQCYSSQLCRKKLISGQVLGPRRTALHTGVKTDLLFALFQRKGELQPGWCGSPLQAYRLDASLPPHTEAVPGFVYTCMQQDMDQQMWREENQHKTKLPEQPHPLDISPEQNCHPSLSQGHYLLLLLSLYYFTGVFQLYRNTVPKDLLGDGLDSFSNQN